MNKIHSLIVNKYFNKSLLNKDMQLDIINNSHFGYADELLLFYNLDESIQDRALSMTYYSRLLFAKNKNINKRIQIKFVTHETNTLVLSNLYRNKSLCEEARLIVSEKRKKYVEIFNFRGSSLGQRSKYRKNC